MLAALAAATLFVYAPVHGFDFVSIDDQVYVANNPLLRADLRWTTLGRVFAQPYANFWHPLTVLSLMFDARVFGIRAGPMHVTAVVLHLACVLLLFLALARATRAPGRSAFVAALFAVHPLHVESVAWIAQRKDVLSTLFWMLTLVAYVEYARAPRWHRYALALLFFALGLMAKPMLVTVPFTLLLFDVWPLGRVGLSGDRCRSSRWPVPTRAWLPLLVEKLPFFALSIAASVVAFVAQRSGKAVASLEGFSLAARLANAPVAYVAYIGKMVWPRVLTVFYPYPVTPPVWPAFGAALALVGITVVVLCMAVRRPYLAVGWIWYLGTLLPVSGLIQVGSHAMADRYTYVPLIGLFVAIAWGAAEIVGRDRARRRVLAVVACAVVAVLAVVARGQAMTWQSSSSLWRHALDVTPDNYYAHNALGLELAKGGRDEEAMAHFRRSAEIAPGFPNPHNNIGLLLAEKGKTGEAIEEYVEALKRAPDYSPARANLANALARAGRIDEAVAQYRAAIDAGADETGTRAKLGAALSDAGRHDEAAREFEQALRLDPAAARTHLGFGNALQRAGRFEAAAAQYREAIRMGPASADMYDNLGIALERTGRSREAVEQFQEALRLDPASVPTRANLGNALIADGRPDEAAAQFRTGLQASPNRVDLHMGLGTALFRMGHQDEALAEHRIAVRLAPGLADAHYNLAATLHGAGRFAEAVAEYEETLRLEGGTPDVHLALGLLYEQLGQARRSASHYGEALKMQPELREAAAGLSRVSRNARAGRQ